jgi:hypothetical protein
VAVVNIKQLASEAAARVAEFDNKHNGSWYCSHEQKNIEQVIYETLTQASASSVSDAHSFSVDTVESSVRSEPKCVKCGKCGHGKKYNNVTRCYVCYVGIPPCGCLCDFSEPESSTSPEQEAVWRLHVPVTNEQHDVASGLISGFCERCRVPWPCQYSPEAVSPEKNESIAQPEFQVALEVIKFLDAEVSDTEMGQLVSIIANRAENESIESALTELRAMNYLDVIVESRHSTGKDSGEKITGSVTIAIWLESGWKEFNAPRLSEAMNAVRQYRASLPATLKL